jgi:hypothetical protein
MLKNRLQTAQKVADSLFAAEEAIDAAFARVAELNGILVAARTEAKVSAVMGQEAFDGAAVTFAALAQARAGIVETHKRLSEVQIEMGLRAVSWGDQGKPATAKEERHLQVVG